MLTEAKKEAEALRREAEIEAKEAAVKHRADIERELHGERTEILRDRERLHAREDDAERRLNELERREQGIADRETHVKQLQEEFKDAKDREVAELERIASLTVGEAKAEILARSEELVRHDLARRVRQLEEEAQTEARRRARNLVADSLQRVAASHAAETTVSIVELPSDDMKGRIIGREGRNIRALEHLTGVDFIIDDTPQAVVLSSFDGMRREIAKLTLQKLLEDGRIHPARIEETYYQSKAEVDDLVRQAGEQAVFEAHCGEFHEELVKILGRLKFRTSYGQNVLKHTLEVVHLAGIMAAELGASVKTAKRAALLHDVGKALTHEEEGSHALISAPLREALRRVRRRRARDRGTPLRGAAADGGGRARDHRRRDLRVTAGRARREPRVVHQATRVPRGAGRPEAGRRARLRSAGRPRDPGDREAGGDRR